MELVFSSDLCKQLNHILIPVTTNFNLKKLSIIRKNYMKNIVRYLLASNEKIMDVGRFITL